MIGKQVSPFGRSEKSDFFPMQLNQNPFSIRRCGFPRFFAKSVALNMSARHVSTAAMAGKGFIPAISRPYNCKEVNHDTYAQAL